MSVYHFTDTEAVEHDVNTVPDSGDFERVEIDGQWYVPERTCENTTLYKEYAFDCSECGSGLSFRGCEPFNYCPSCGARVIEEQL